MTLFSTFKYIATLIFVLFVLIVVAVLQLNTGYKNEQVSIDLERELYSIGQQLAQGSDYLTSEIRRYTQFGEKVHFDNFWREVNETRSRDKAVERLKELNVLPSELFHIEKAKEYSDNLIKTEEAAMAAVENKDLYKARQLVFGDYYDEQKKLIMGNIKKFQNVVNTRASERTQELMQRNSRHILLINTLLVISGFLLIFGFYGIGIRRLILPINKATITMLKLADDDLEIEIPTHKSNDEIGAIYSALMVFKENVVKRRKVESNMEQLVEERTMEMEEFTYRTSHDLKAPLVNIRGLSNIMREDLEDGDYEEVSENIQKIGALSLKLENLVGEIVNAAKVNRESEEFEKVDILREVESIKESLSTLIDEKQVEVQFSLGSNKTLWTQKNLIQRVLENLISNAIKYSDPGKPQRFVKVDVSPGLNGDTQIQVLDNGLGIPDQYFSEVFGMFKRFHKEASFGSGLGLYLVKKSLDKISGKISLESSPEGTVFTMILPDKKSASHETPY